MKLFSLSGRATRAQWWAVNICGLVVGLVVAIGIVYSIQSMLDDPSMAGGLIVFIGSLFSLVAYLLISFAVTVRRLHDRGRSGWFYLVYWILNMIPFVNVISGIAFVVDMGVLDGVYGPNKYGEDPKGQTSPLQQPQVVVSVCQNNGINDSKSSKAKFCTNCGATIESDASFCVHCGHKI